MQAHCKPAQLLTHPLRVSFRTSQYVGQYLETAATENDGLPLEIVAFFYLCGLLAAYYFCDSVVFWRGMSLTLEVELRGLYDPLSLLDNFPRLKWVAKVRNERKDEERHKNDRFVFIS